METLLMTPGPTPIPSFVQKAMERSYGWHHRHPEFESVFSDVCHRFPGILGSPGAPLLVTSSGTGGMEALVQNLFNPGEHVVVVSIGKFGERWRDIAQRRGLNVTILSWPWGEPGDPQTIADTCYSDKSITGLLLQACETSTGVENDVKTLMKLLSSWKGFIIIDGITGVGSMDFSAVWKRADGVVFGSQKAWMLPPGLAFIWCSDRSWEKMQTVKLRPYYFDLLALKKSQENGRPLFTPPIPLIAGLQAVFDYLEAIGGINELVKRTRVLAQDVRKRLTEQGWKLFPKKNPAGALTAVHLPHELQGTSWLEFIKQKTGLILAGGQGPLKGKIFRIGHLGWTNAILIRGFIEKLPDLFRDFLKEA